MSHAPVPASAASAFTSRRQLLSGTAALALFDALRGGTLAQLVLRQRAVFRPWH